MFRISSSWKLEAVFLKTGYLQSKNSEQKIHCLKIHVYVKNCHKKINCVKFQTFIIQVKQNLIQNYVKCHIIFSFVKLHLSIIQIYTIQIQIVLSYYKLHRTPLRPSAAFKSFQNYHIYEMNAHKCHHGDIITQVLIWVGCVFIKESHASRPEKTPVYLVSQSVMRFFKMPVSAMRS